MIFVTIRDYLPKITSLKPYVSPALMDIFVVAIILMNAFIFFSYLYAPLIGNAVIPEVKKPVLNEMLLSSVSRKIDENDQDLSRKIQLTYPDPFE